MIHSISAVNWLGVAAAFFAYFLLGGMWFTLLFKKSYAVSLSKDHDKLNNSSVIFILGPALCSLAITITSAMLMELLQIHTFGKAIGFALIIGIGYLVANTVNIAINPNMPRPIMYAAISGAFHLVGITIASIILVAV